MTAKFAPKRALTPFKMLFCGLGISLTVIALNGCSDSQKRPMTNNTTGDNPVLVKGDDFGDRLITDTEPDTAIVDHLVDQKRDNTPANSDYEPMIAENGYLLSEKLKAILPNSTLENKVFMDNFAYYRLPNYRYELTMYEDRPFDEFVAFGNDVNPASAVYYSRQKVGQKVAEAGKDFLRALNDPNYDEARLTKGVIQQVSKDDLLSPLANELTQAISGNVSNQDGRAATQLEKSDDKR